MASLLRGLVFGLYDTDFSRAIYFCAPLVDYEHAMRIVGQEASLVDASSVGSWASASRTVSKFQSSTTLQSNQILIPATLARQQSNHLLPLWLLNGPQIARKYTTTLGMSLRSSSFLLHAYNRARYCKPASQLASKRIGPTQK